MPPEHLCREHSGILMWMKINAILGTVAVTLLGYSSFIQVPNLRYDIAREQAQMQDTLNRDIQAIKDRISRLEAKLR